MQFSSGDICIIINAVERLIKKQEENVIGWLKNILAIAYPE